MKYSRKNNINGSRKISNASISSAVGEMRRYSGCSAVNSEISVAVELGMPVPVSVSLPGLRVGLPSPYNCANKPAVGVISSCDRVGIGEGETLVGQGVRVGSMGVGVYGVSGACVQVGGKPLISHSAQSLKLI